MAPVYSAKVLEHFRNPRNVGKLEHPDGVGVEGNPVCGDLMEIQIQVEHVGWISGLFSNDLQDRFFHSIRFSRWCR